MDKQSASARDKQSASAKDRQWALGSGFVPVTGSRPVREKVWANRILETHLAQASRLPGFRSASPAEAKRQKTAGLRM
jgi:hypothetical protein